MRLGERVALDRLKKGVPIVTEPDLEGTLIFKQPDRYAIGRPEHVDQLRRMGYVVDGMVGADFLRARIMRIVAALDTCQEGHSKRQVLGQVSYALSQAKPVERVLGYRACPECGYELEGDGDDYSPFVCTDCGRQWGGLCSDCGQRMPYQEETGAVCTHQAETGEERG